MIFNLYLQKHQGPKIANPINFSHGYTQFKLPSTVHFTKSFFLKVILDWMNYLGFQIFFFSHFCSPQNGEKQTGRALHWGKIEKKKGSKEKKGHLREKESEKGTTSEKWAVTDWPQTQIEKRELKSILLKLLLHLFTLKI